MLGSWLINYSNINTCSLSSAKKEENREGKGGHRQKLSQDGIEQMVEGRGMEEWGREEGDSEAEEAWAVAVIAVQSLSRVRLFATPWTAAHQASPSFTISQSLLKLRSTESVMPSNYLIFVPFSSCLQSFPASREISWLRSPKLYSESRSVVSNSLSPLGLYSLPDSRRRTSFQTSYH